MKIADFGLSAALPKDGEKFTKQCGSLTFMMPEIHQNKPYDGRQADLFAASVVLFIMLTGCPPFTKAAKSDIMYKCFTNDKIDLFWKFHEKNTPLSESLKDLLTKMFTY